MTYKKLYEIAEWKLDHGELTLGEFDEMTKPLDEEIRIWIPCSERLPEEDGKYLVERVASWGAEICIADYSQGGKYWYEDATGYEYRGVIAWMPLPELYEKEGEQNG